MEFKADKMYILLYSKYSLAKGSSMLNCRRIANVQKHGFILVLDLRIVFIVLIHNPQPE